jgi:aldehyde reductase
MVKVPLIKLNNGLSMPALGLGTWQGPPGKEAEVGQAVKDAIDVGYRHFDCAHVYGNEKIIGEAIQDKIKEGAVKREELFIVSKVWNTFHRPDLVEPALKETLKNLKLEYLDLYLVHWPHAFKEGSNLHPIDSKTGLFIPSDVDYIDTWKAMEKVNKKGLTKSIGISNFNSKQIERLLKSAEIVPVTNQIECHPYLNQAKLRKFCSDRGITVTSYSPLGSPSRPWQKPGDPDVINDPKIRQIGNKYGKSPAQILLRYNVQLGNSVIPKSSNKERLLQNLSENLKYSGYETLDRIIGFDLETTNLILKALAKFHAGPLAMKLLNSQVFKTKIRSLFTPYKVFEFDEDTLSLCVEKNRKIVEEIGTCKKYIQRVVDGFKMNLQPVKNSPDCIREPFATIIHTDAWVNNFMVQFHEGKPVSCKIVDFQLDEYGSPARDLIFFIFTSVQIPVVLQHYEELIGLYHKTLVDDLVKFGCDPAPFSRQEFEEEITVMAKEEFGHCMMMLQPIFATKDTLKELDEYDVDDMTRVDTISPKYKERAAFIIEEFVKRDWI